MTFVVGLIYAGTILFCVGATAWLLRAWTRRRYPHKSPSDLHYIVTGTALLLSAGIGVLVASLIASKASPASPYIGIGDRRRFSG